MEKHYRIQIDSPLLSQCLRIECLSFCLNISKVNVLVVNGPCASPNLVIFAKDGKSTGKVSSSTVGTPIALRECSILKR